MKVIFWGQTENIDDLKIESGLYLLTVTDQNGMVSKQKIVRK
ncbi:MAG: T9SS type A sorting domain-containing protein [Flavobacterium sp.]|nr:T9SS type A sorting domain-containing protein [Flavobacterium sp.]